MSRLPFYFSVLILGVFVALISGCETIPLEECEQEEICAGKTVTACCDEIECYYMYNGVKYNDDADSLTQLAKDLNCTFTGMADYDAEIGNLVLQINALGELARMNISKAN